jgi:serine/threonine protein kinase
MLANLQHPNLMPLFDTGDVGVLPFYVMPYVEGETLRERLQHEHQLPIAESLRLAISSARALHCAHRHGVVHRDVKPENILLRDGQVILADFGIAFSLRERASPRLTEVGAAIGTPHYMSPEQAAGDDDVDHRTDVYSLGVVLYEMLCGEPPHVGPNSRAIIAHILTRTASPASALRRTISHGLDASLSRALEKEASDRFQTAADFADALESV